MGDQPRDILHGAVDEILCTLKNSEMKDKEKKKETEELLGTTLAEERFALLVNLGKKITDYAHEEKATGNEAIDETGINVQFQESDEEMDEDEDDGYDDEGEDEGRGQRDSKSGIRSDVASDFQV